MTLADSNREDFDGPITLDTTVHLWWTAESAEEAAAWRKEAEELQATNIDVVPVGSGCFDVLFTVPVREALRLYHYDAESLWDSYFTQIPNGRAQLQALGVQLQVEQESQ